MVGHFDRVGIISFAMRVITEYDHTTYTPNSGETFGVSERLHEIEVLIFDNILRDFIWSYLRFLFEEGNRPLLFIINRKSVTTPHFVSYFFVFDPLHENSMILFLSIALSYYMD